MFQYSSSFQFKVSEHFYVQIKIAGKEMSDRPARRCVKVIKSRDGSVFYYGIRLVLPDRKWYIQDEVVEKTRFRYLVR